MSNGDWFLIFLAVVLASSTAFMAGRESKLSAVECRCPCHEPKPDDHKPKPKPGVGEGLLP